MKYYYKVVTVSRHGLISYNTGNDTFLDHNKVYLDNGHAIVYKIGEWVYPKIDGTNLFIFDNLENAKNLCHRSLTNNKIFKCQAKNVSNRGISTGKLGIETNTLKKMLKLKKRKKKFLHLSEIERMYPGTLYCTAVKLIEEVK